MGGGSASRRPDEAEPEEAGLDEYVCSCGRVGPDATVGRVNSQREHTTIPCPSCGQPATPGVGCPACGITLSGPVAQRLWQVDQQLAALGVERQQLLVRLRTPGSGPEPVQVSSDPAPYPRYPAPAARLGDEHHAARSLSGQQVILGLGALLLLSAAALFTVVVWLVVGLVGQAVILAALTAVAVTGSRLLARRGLAAAAETAAVIAVGLTLVGANAAHARGLADLDRFAADGYWAVALLICGVLFLGFDRVASAGAEDRGPWVYPPAAALALAGAPALVLSALDAAGLALQAGAGIAAVILGVGALLTWESSRRPSTRAAALVAGVAAVAAAALFAGLGLALAYDASQPVATRYVAGALLLGAVATSLLTPPVRHLGPAAVVATLGLLLPAVLLEAPYQVDALLAALLAAASIGLLRSWGSGGAAAATWGWLRSLAVGAVWLHLVLLAVVVDATDAGTPAFLARGTDPVSWWAPVVPAAALLAVAAAGLWLFRAPGWVWAVQVALAVTTWSALVQAPALAVYVALLGLTTLEMTVSILALRGVRSFSWLLTPERPSLAHLVELLGLAAAALGFVGACVAAVPTAEETGAADAVLGAIACYATALLVFVYAGQRGRLGFSYLGSLLTSSGSWLLLAEGGVTLVEAYTLPLAAMLAIVGAVTHRRARAEGQVAGSMLTMGPALAVALGPSTAYALGEGGTVRTLLVVAAGVVCVLAGYGLRLKAPVLAGAVSLGLVAVTEGGPYLSYVPGWLTIGAAGALLLAVGISWEAAVLAGRRSTAWFTALR